MARRKKMIKGFKFKVFLIVLICVIAIFGTALFFAGSLLTKNFIAERVEESLNCRFELENMELSLFSSNSSVVLEGVKLAKRDSFANDGTPHDERPKLSEAEVEIGKIELDVSLLNLLFRNLHVRKFLIEKAHANVVLYTDGANSLDELLASPDEEDKKAKEERETFNIKENPNFAASLKEFELKDCSVNVVIESSMLQIQARAINLKLLEEFDIDVEDLVNTEPSKWEMSTQVNLTSGDGKLEYGKLSLDGDVNGLMFDLQSGDLDPVLELKLGLGEDSYLKQVPVLHKISDLFLDIQKLPWLGDITQKKWPETYVFTEYKSVHLKVEGNKYSFLSPLAVDLGDWSLQLKPGSWLRSNDSMHEFVFHMYASGTVSSLIEKSFSYAQKVLPSAIAANTKKEINKLFSDDDKFFLKFKTIGKLSKPSAKLVSELPDIKDVKDMMIDEGKKEVKKRLLDLFGR